MSEGQFCALYVLAALVLSGVWGVLARLPATLNLALLAALTASAWLRRQEPRSSFAGARGLAPPPARTLEALAVGAAACAPAAVFLALTWRQEFPFSGDQDFHLAAHLLGLPIWARATPKLLALAAGLWLAARRRLLPWAIPAAFALLWLWSWPLTMPYAYARYPGAAYVLGLPWDALARALRWDFPLDAPRLANVLCLPLWLLVLRPWLVRRWPDRRVLPFCLFFFWQKDHVWLFASGYLEPPAVILTLLAVELAMDAEGARALDACLLAGAAAMAKEQALLLVPFLWLAARPWALDARGRLRAALAGVASTAPFAVYMVVRRATGVERGIGGVRASDLFDASRLAEYGRRLLFTFHAPGLVAAALCLGALAWAAAGARSRRAKVLWLSAAGAFQLLFFYAGHGSIAWTGYPRFNMLGWAVLGAAGLLACGDRLEGRGPAARAAWAGTAALGLLNACVLGPFLAQAAALPDPYRGATLHYDDPVFLDIAALEREGRERGALEGVSTLVLADRLGTYTTDSWFDAYAGLRRRYRLGTLKTTPPGGAPPCRCVAPDVAVLVPFRLQVGLNAGKKDATEDALRVSCVESLRATCARVVEDRHGEDLLGVLGAGLKDASARPRR